MRITHIINLIFLIILTSSCGKKSNSKGKQIVRIPEAQVQEVLLNQRFSCDSVDADDCPEGISRLFIVNPANNAQSAVCTGFMVGPTTLVTNHHCVQNEAECANTFIAVYQGDKYLPTRCRRIIKTEEDFPQSDTRRSVDYTVLEIEDDYDGKKLSLSQTAASSGENISAWVVDHTGADLSQSNLYEARITELRCRAIAQADQSSMILNNCPVIHGNSGSPALNDEGKVIGVIWGGTAKFNSTLDLETRRDQKEFAAVTEVIHFFDFAR